MSYIGLLPQKGQIDRKTRVIDDAGRMTSSWQVGIYTDVPCRVDKIGNFTSTLAQTPTGQTSRNEFVVFMLPDQDVIPGDRLTIDGVVMYVTPYLSVFSARALHHKEVYASIQET
jgi:hypothetical protein